MGEPTRYTPHPFPSRDERQDDGVPDLAVATFLAADPMSPRDWRGALSYARDQARHETDDWVNYCQKFVRSCYGIPALFSSAWTQWLGADAADKHPGGSPDDAPVGAALCYKGSGKFGHIMLAGRPFKSGTAAGWSNDLVAYGQISKVPRTAPTTQWGQGYLGYLTAVCGYDLRLKSTEPPKPRQTKPYAMIDVAIAKMQRALDTATAQSDDDDADVLRREILRLEKMYATLRRS